MTSTNALVFFFIGLGVEFTCIELAADCRERGGSFVSLRFAGSPSVRLTGRAA